MNATTPDSSPLAQTLSDLIARSLSQLTILRSALDEATLVESSARSVAADLASRLASASAATAAMDAGLARCDTAAATYENAARAIDELNAVAAQIRTASAAIDQRINAQLADHQRRLESLLAEHQARFDARIAEFDAAFAAQLGELREVHARATASAHNACERAIQSTRAAGANATEAARQTIAAVEEDIAARAGVVTGRLREQAAEAATDAMIHIAKSREADDNLRDRLEQAAQIVDLLDRRLAEILNQQQKQPPLRKAA